MRHCHNILFFIALLVYGSGVVAAVNIVECEDAQGNRIFQKTCPPGMVEVSSKRISTGSSDKDEQQQGSLDLEVVLYVIPNCGACTEVREFLQAKEIAFTEKDVSEDISLQQELTELAGSLGVPTTVFGDEVVTGYQRSQMESIIEQAGSADDDPSEKGKADKGKADKGKADKGEADAGEN